MRTLIFILLSGFSALGGNITNLYVNQSLYVGLNLTTVPSGSGAWYPTNISNCNAWWNGDNVLTNASGQVTNWTDSWVNSYRLTNQITGKIPSVGILNSHLTTSFDGVDDYLKCLNYTNQPLSAPIAHEVFIIMKYEDATNVNHVFFDSTTASFENLGRSLNSSLISMGAGTTLTSTNAFSDNWLLVTLTFDGSNSRISTNNVVIKSGNAGTSAMSGLTLGASYSLSASKVSYAEIFTYSATNTSSDRSNIWYYTTNKYGKSNFGF